MKRQLLRTAIVGSLFFGAILLGLGSQEATLEKGSAAPSLAWDRLDGSRGELTQHAGQVVLINFWTTWCPPCREEMPALVAVARRFGERGVVFVAANLDDAAEQKEAVARYTQPLPELAAHTALVPPQAALDFQVDVFPTTYVLDRQGAVAWAHVGAVTEAQLAEVLEDVLAAP